MKNVNYLLIIILLIGTCISCSKRNDSTTQLKFTEILKIGSENSLDDNELIGMMGGFTVDNNGSIYILDSAFKVIKKYSPTGIFIKAIGNGEGKGPGEFLEPRELDIDRFNNLYVTDIKKMDITIFDSTGYVKDIIKLKYQPACLKSFSPNDIFISTFPNSYTNCIYKFNVANSDSNYLGFGKHYNGEFKYEVENAGYCPHLTKATNDKLIICSEGFPYSTKIYNIEGDLKFELKRKVEFFEPPYVKQTQPLYVFAPSVIWNNCILNDSLLINLLFYINENNETFTKYLDIWNLKDKKFIGCFSEKELGIELSFFIYADKKGFFYNYSNEPYPHIKKYKVTLIQ